MCTGDQYSAQLFAGIGGASHEGVLVKGSNYLETMARTKYVVFDKTGTMTQGVFEVSGVHHNTIPEEQLLEYAALAECSSSHPISKSLQKAYGKQIHRDRVTEIEELSGKGVTAKVDGIPVAAGNAKLMKYLNVEYSECEETGTIVHVAVDGKYAGHILISDKLKPHAKEAVRDLKKAGITKTVMLTGDMKRVADKVAEELGIGEVYSELLPADKVAKVEELLEQKSEKEKLAFVGDGINDAPVLSRADIGIAMGALGSDAAIEAADVVLMDDDPKKIAKAIRISRKCMRIVYENIYLHLESSSLPDPRSTWNCKYVDGNLCRCRCHGYCRIECNPCIIRKTLIEKAGGQMAKIEEGMEVCDSCEVHENLLKIVNEKMPEETELYDLAELFKVFGDSTRMRILFVLFEAEVCVCDLAEALNMTQSAISHQLRILKQNKLVKSRREGKSVFYSLADDHVRTIVDQGREHIEEDLY